MWVQGDAQSLAFDYHRLVCRSICHFTCLCEMKLALFSTPCQTPNFSSDGSTFF